MKKSWLAAGAVVMICGGILLFSEKQEEVAVAEAVRMKISNTLEVTGEMQPANYWTVISQQAGRVGSVFFREGDYVQEQDCIVELDSTDLKQKRTEIEQQARTVQAIANGNTEGDVGAQLIFAAQQAGVEFGLYNGFLSNNTTKAASAKAEAESAPVNSQLLAIDEQIAACRLKAGLSGKLLQVNVREGEIVAAGSNLATVADLQSMRIMLYVSERNLRMLREGMNCTFCVSEEDTVYKGIVKELGACLKSAGEAYSGTEKMAEVTIEPKSISEGFFPGSAADVSIVIEENENALCIPIKSLTKDETVFVLKADGTVEERNIALGIVGHDMVEVKSGVSEGEQVLLEPEKGLSSGAKVK